MDREGIDRCERDGFRGFLLLFNISRHPTDMEKLPEQAADESDTLLRWWCDKGTDLALARQF